MQEINQVLGVNFMVCGVHGRLAISAVDRILLGNQGSMMLIIELGLVVKLDLAPTTIIVNIEIIMHIFILLIGDVEYFLEFPI